MPELSTEVGNGSLSQNFRVSKCPTSGIWRWDKDHLLEPPPLIIQTTPPKVLTPEELVVALKLWNFTGLPSENP
jgi:hypothetical protein